MAILGSIISGIGSLAGSLTGGLLGKSSVDRTNQYNMELAKYQASQNKLLQDNAFSQSKEMWNLENQYNSPAAQMARLKTAGLNPNLMYGQGNTGNASGAPQYKASSYDAPTLQPYTGWNLGSMGLNQAVQVYQQEKALKSTIATQESVAALNQAKSDTERLNALSRTIANERDSYNLDILKDTQADVVKGIRARAESDYLKAQKDNYDVNTFDENGRPYYVRSLVANTLSREFANDLSRAELKKVEELTKQVIQTRNFEKFEQDLYKATGITRNSAVYYRLTGIIAKALGFDLNELGKMFNP